MRRLSVKTLALLSILAMMFWLLGNFVLGSTDMSLSEVDVRLYVVALDGVSGGGVSNISRVIEGVLSVCLVNRLRYNTGEWATPHGYVHEKIRINTTAILVNEWDTYREIVEFGSNIIIVNVHGETVPVPAGFTKEGWVDKIAEAMAYRNVTWVHTAGYPFYYYYHQEGVEGTWGEEGFKQLVKHIGKGDAECHSHFSETTKMYMHENAGYTLFHEWGELLFAYSVERGRPLNASYFEDCRVAIIWGTEDHDMTGAIIKYAKADQTDNYGFYVHVGTSKTFDSGGGVTDADYYRGYAGAAQAIYTFSFRTASEEAISESEKAVNKAENEGRTKGLNEARQLLQQAKEYYDLSHYVFVLRNANKVIEAANNAFKPSWAEDYALHLAMGIIVSVVIATSSVMIWKKNSRKNRETL